jgi:hypothetical protein
MSSKRPKRTSPRFDAWLRQEVDEVFADPRPNVPAREVFKRLRAHHARSAKAKRSEKI